MRYLCAIVFFMIAGLARGQDTKPWEATEVWEPQPPIVTPGSFTRTPPPSDAIILFDGTDLSQWQKPQLDFQSNMKHIVPTLPMLDPDFEHLPADWVIENGAMVVVPGSGAIETVRKFGDMQLHLEWLSPVDEGKTGQGYSNSGVYFMKLYELQVLNSYENDTYVNGQAGAIYKQYPPLVNASRPPGEWQSYDVVFIAPRFHPDGSLEHPARITAHQNGILIQDNVELRGPTLYIGSPFYVAHPEALSLKLQDHGDKVRFRNIWAREL